MFTLNLRLYGYLIAMLCTLLGAGNIQATPIKIAFMHQNPVGEGGWTLAHEKARARIDAHYGDKIKTSAVDGITPSVDADRTLTKLARSGNELIFATSFGFLSPTQRIAKRYPKTRFMHASGYITTRNIGTYQIRAYHGRYMAGVAAAMVSNTKTVGYVVPFPIPEVVRGINAFALGMQSVDPSIKLELIWINTWSDAQKSREATELLISKGADVITHHTETSAAIAAAEAAGVWSIGYQTDRSAAAPKHHLVSIEHNWFPMYKHIIDTLLAGTWKGDSIWYGAEKDASQLVGWGSLVPNAVKAAVNDRQQAIKSGSLNVFSGPLKNQYGQEKVAEGGFINDEALGKMQWLVEGISGQLPNS